MQSEGGVRIQNPSFIKATVGPFPVAPSPGADATSSDNGTSDTAPTLAQSLPPDSAVYALSQTVRPDDVLSVIDGFDSDGNVISVVANYDPSGDLNQLPLDGIAYDYSGADGTGSLLEIDRETATTSEITTYSNNIAVTTDYTAPSGGGTATVRVYAYDANTNVGSPKPVTYTTVAAAVGLSGVDWCDGDCGDERADRRQRERGRGRGVCACVGGRHDGFDCSTAAPRRTDSSDLGRATASRG